MDKFDLYRDISMRTGGDIYVGVVGPVRTGKSSFIKAFMEGLVLDNIADKNSKIRAVDELPQSADGRTIMTTQPKFVPNEAVRVQFGENLKANIRMIDCVGYLVDGAIGHREDGKERLVRTPWDEKEMPFSKAAEIGTEKVIKEHSTIGILVTTDGSISDLERKNYVVAEERVVNELKECGKPFIVLLNSKNPNSDSTLKLQNELQEKYDVSVVAKDVLNLKEGDMIEIMESVLLEFPVKQIDANAPKWVQSLDVANEIVAEMMEKMSMVADHVKKMRDAENMEEIFQDSEFMTLPKSISMDAGTGKVMIDLEMRENLFYEVASAECGQNLSSDFEMLCYLKQLSMARNKTEKLQLALEEAEELGYGIVYPTMEEMELEEPTLLKQGSQYGVKLRAKAPSLHIVKIDVQTEVSPIVGNEDQSKELVDNMIQDFQENKDAVWETNIFGKTLSSLVNDGLNSKLNNMPQDAKSKMRKTVTRIVNEGRGGVICILL